MNDENISLPIPFFYNMPLKPFRSFDAFTFFNVTECEEWYLYQFNENTTTQEDRDYFGMNEGLPMNKPNSRGMLTGGKNILEMPCQDINRSVPFFKELVKNSQPEDANTLNKHIYKELDSLSQRDFDLSAKVGKIDGLELIPDGMIEIRSSNSRKFDYRLSV